jgi:hypothetical protein
MYLVHYGDLRTGRLTATMPAASASWTTELLSAGSASVSLAPTARAREVWQAASAGASLWAVEWAEGGARRILAAGPIWTKDLDEDSVTLGGSGLFSVFAKRRLVANVAASAVPKTDLTYSGLDLGSIQRAIVAQVLALPDGDLPVVLEAPRAGTHSRAYLGYETTWVAQRLSELASVDNGPEFSFSPRLTSDGLGVEWVLRTGTETAPHLGRTAPVVLDGTAPLQRLIRGVSGGVDASTLSTTAWAVGGGTERAQVVRSSSDSTLTERGFPRLEVEETNEATDSATVQAYAAGLQARTSRPAQALTVTVDAAAWYASGADLGDTVRVLYRHPIVGPLDITSRVTATSASLDAPVVVLTLADTLAEDLF